VELPLKKNEEELLKDKVQVALTHPDTLKAADAIITEASAAVTLVNDAMKGRKTSRLKFTSLEFPEMSLLMI